MNTLAPRHGAFSDFLALTDGLSISRTAETLRCCTRTIRNYIAGRSPILWHRIELLRLRAHDADTTRTAGAIPQSPDNHDPDGAANVVANMEPDPASPDVPDGYGQCRQEIRKTNKCDDVRYGRRVVGFRGQSHDRCHRRIHVSVSLKWLAPRLSA